MLYMYMILLEFINLNFVLQEAYLYITFKKGL